MAAPFQGRYSQQFLADLQRLDPPIQTRSLEAIERKLLTEPFKRGRLVGEKPERALRS